MINKITIEDVTYDVDDDNRILGVNAHCYGENHYSHPYCYSSPKGFDEAEDRSEIHRLLDESGWHWYVLPVN